jgi:hypothetical protein
MPTKRNFLIKVVDAKIVDVKRALEAKGIKLDSIYEMYKEDLDAGQPAAAAASAGTATPANPPAAGTTGKETQPPST